MRLHSDVLTAQDIRAALIQEKHYGRIATSVGFKELSEHRSTTHTRAFEVQLDSDEKLDGDGRRYGNSGSYGRGERYTATFDEWGWLLARLYYSDSKMRTGSQKYPTYEDMEDFHDRTGFTYYPQALLPFLANTVDPYPYVIGHDTVGRHGASRVHATALRPPFARYAPRDADDYAAWAHVHLKTGRGWIPNVEESES